jgi:hypothetical protein
MPPQAPPQPLPPSPIDPQMQNSMQQLIGDQSMPAGGGDMRFNKIVSAFAVGPDLKSTFAKYAADDDSSLLGRYGALWGLQSQSAISKPWSSTAASGAGSAASAAAGMPGIILAPLSNVVAMRGPDKEKRLHGMVSDAKARKGHFGESFMHGISRAGIPYGLWRSGSGFPLGLSMA